MIIDKPISTDVSVAEKICDMATQHNIIISVGFQDRYQDLIDEARALLEGREIGLINAAWVGGIPGVYWWRRRSTSGGQIIEQHIHHFDLLRYLVGEPVSLYTAAGKGMVKPNAVNLPGYDIEDYSATAVSFRNGSVANIFTGDYMAEGGGMKGGITFYAKDATVDYVIRSKIVFTDKNGTKEILPDVDSGELLDRAFIDAVKSGRPEDLQKIRSPYFDAIKTLKFAVATNTSIDTGNAVYLNL
jgi:predicted dehydrogenase